MQFDEFESHIVLLFVVIESDIVEKQALLTSFSFLFFFITTRYLLFYILRTRYLLLFELVAFARTYHLFFFQESKSVLSLLLKNKHSHPSAIIFMLLRQCNMYSRDLL